MSEPEEDPLIEAIDKLVDELSSSRTELLRIKRLLRERLKLPPPNPFADEKTPVRPASQAALEAFRNSSDFLHGKKPT